MSIFDRHAFVKSSCKQDMGEVSCSNNLAPFNVRDLNISKAVQDEYNNHYLTCVT